MPLPAQACNNRMHLGLREPGAIFLQALVPHDRVLLQVKRIKGHQLGGEGAWCHFLASPGPTWQSAIAIEMDV